MKLSLAAAAAAVSLAIVGGALADPAHADTWRHSDAVGDVVVHDYTEGGQVPPRTEQGVKQGDLVNVTARYAGSTLQVATTMRAYSVPDNEWRLTVVTSRGDRYEVERWQNYGDGLLWNTMRRNGYEYVCDGLVLNRTSTGMVAKIPRQCLSDAYRVRIGVTTELNYEPVRYEINRYVYDDALRAGHGGPHPATLSPWIVSS